MDNFDVGGIFGSLFGESEAGAGGEVVGGLLEMFGVGGKAEKRELGAPVVYERYLCGGPTNLNLNDR